jgi:hypothetical protein
MVEIWAEGAKPISFSSKVLNIHVVWPMDERPIGLLTDVISVCHTFVALNLWSRYGQREGQAHLILQQGFKHMYMVFSPWTKDL